MHVMHVAQNAVVHHAFDGLIEIAVAPLQAGLEGLLGILRGEGAQAVHFLGLEHEALFAEHVLAGHQRIARDAVVLEQRSGDEDRLHVLLGEQFAIILVGFRVVADELDGLIEVGLLDIAQTDAAAVVDAAQVLEQILATAAGTDHAELNLLAGGLYCSNGGEALHLRKRGCGRGHGASDLQYVTAGNTFVLWHMANLG